MANNSNHTKRLRDENEIEIELLKTALQIEQTKVRCLKKMLKAEYEMSGDKGLNFNSIFGLDISADKSIVKTEFKKLLKALHPDRGGDDRLFKVFNEHYSKVK